MLYLILIILTCHFFNFFNFFSTITFLINNLIFNIYIVIFIFIYLKKNKTLPTIVLIISYIFGLINKKPQVATLCYKKSIKYKEISLELFNGLIQFHPCVFYISLILLLLIIYNFKFFKKLVNVFYSQTLFKILFISMFSGGYWSYLHLTWGNWWTWDVIELILLFLIFLYIQVMHKFIQKNITFSPIFINLYCTLILYIFLVRFSYVSSKHNFFKMQSTPTALSLFIQIGLISFITLGINTKIKKLLNNYKKNKTEISMFFVFICWIIIYALSNFFYKLNLIIYIYSIFFYSFILLKFLLKNNKKYMWHIFFILLVMPLFYFKTNYTKFNTNRQNNFYVLNYKQNFFINLFYTLLPNQSIELFVFDINKLTIFNNYLFAYKHNFIFFHKDVNFNDSLTSYNFLLSQKINYSHFNIIKHNYHNIYETHQLYKVVSTIYLLAFFVVLSI